MTSYTVVSHVLQGSVEHDGHSPGAVVAIRSLLVAGQLAVVRTIVVRLDELVIRLQRQMDAAILIDPLNTRYTSLRNVYHIVLRVHMIGHQILEKTL